MENISSDYQYDVALSFAGENREYVDKVALLLRAKGIKVFYDKFETANLWGKDLGAHFAEVYGKQSRHFIPFISNHYKEKVWTNYEMKTAIARAIENREEDYILPVRIDKTEIAGIHSTTGFIDISTMIPEELVNVIIEKLRPNLSGLGSKVYMSDELTIKIIPAVDQFANLFDKKGPYKIMGYQSAESKKKYQEQIADNLKRKGDILEYKPFRLPKELERFWKHPIGTETVFSHGTLTSVGHFAGFRNARKIGDELIINCDLRIRKDIKINLKAYYLVELDLNSKSIRFLNRTP